MYNRENDKKDERMKNDIKDLKKFIKIALVWICIPALCIFLSNSISIFVDMSDGILLYFLILEMIKISKDILKK